MRILMYADGFGVPTQTFITQDVKYLSKNHEILFICTVMNKSVSIPYVRVEHIPMSQTFLQKVLWKLDLSLSFKNPQAKTKISKIIQDFKPDVIHCQFGIEALRFIDNLEDTTIPLTIQYRGYDASRMLHKKTYVKRLKEVMARPNTSSIYVADSLRQNLKRHHIHTEPSMILHSGINLTHFKPQHTSSENKPFIFLQISSLKEKKGHRYTLKAFAKFLQTQDNDNYLLQLTGDGRELSELQELTNALNISKYVEFIGFVSHDKARVLLQKANVFVHHSITPADGDEEGIPNAVMEAMAMELPVITTYHAGLPELVTDGVHGYLVKERDIEAYTQKMQDILTWNKLPINREWIEKEFEIHYHIKKLENFYRQLLS